MNENARPVSPGLIDLSNVRASHLYCFEPYTGQASPQIPNPKPTYKGHFLLPPTHPDLVRVAEKIKEIAVLKWKDKATMILEALKGKDAICLHKGDVSQAGQPEYAGIYYVAGSNERPFTIVDRDRSPLFPKDMRPYSGCYVNVKLDIWAQDNKWGKRINCTITGLQFVRDGEAFKKGAPLARPDEFGIVATDADATAPAAGADPVAGLLG